MGAGALVPVVDGAVFRLDRGVCGIEGHGWEYWSTVLVVGLEDGVAADVERPVYVVAIAIFYPQVTTPYSTAVNSGSKVMFYLHTRHLVERYAIHFSALFILGPIRQLWLLPLARIFDELRASQQNGASMLFNL